MNKIRRRDRKIEGIKLLKQIPGFPDYAASESGQIISFRTAAPKILKPISSRSTGYMAVCLSDKNSKFITVYVHRIIAQTFYKKEETRFCLIRHRNGNKKDNSLSNIELLPNMSLNTVLDLWL